MSRAIFITDSVAELKCSFFPVPWVYNTDGANFMRPEMNYYIGNDLKFYEKFNRPEELECVVVHASIGDYSFLEDYVNLKQLYIYDDAKLEDLSFVTKLKQLKYLHISGSNVHDITPIAKLLEYQLQTCQNILKEEYVHPIFLPKLKCISVQNSKVTDLTPFSGIETILTDFKSHDQWLVGSNEIDCFFVSNENMKQEL